MIATDTFFSAWSEPDDAAQLAIISAVATDRCIYDDPRSQDILTGEAAIPDYVGNFACKAIGASVVVIKTEPRGASERAEIALRCADGVEQTGQYFIDNDGDKITRMVGFVGTGAAA